MLHARPTISEFGKPRRLTRPLPKIHFIFLSYLQHQQCYLANINAVEVTLSFSELQKQSLAVERAPSQPFPAVSKMKFAKWRRSLFLLPAFLAVISVAALVLYGVNPFGTALHLWPPGTGGLLIFGALLMALAAMAVWRVSHSIHSLIQSRDAALAALNDREGRLREFTEIISDWAWETDSEHRMTYISGSIARFGTQPSDVIGKTIPGPIDQTFVPGALEQNLSDLSLRKPFRDFVYRIQMGNGGYHWVNLAGAPQFAPDGRFLGYRGIGRFATAEIEQTLLSQISERQLTQAIEGSPLGVALFDSSDRLVTCNSRYQRDYRPGEPCYAATGMTFEEISRSRIQNAGIKGLIPDAELRFAQRLAEHRNPGSGLEFELSDGRWLHTSDQRTEDGGRLTISTDITEMKRRETALRQSNEQFRVTFEAASIGMVIVYRDWADFRANPALCRLVEYSEDELRALKFIGCFHPDDQPAARECTEGLWSGKIDSAHLEQRLITKSGKILDTVATVAVVTDAAGKPAQTVVQLMDVTDAKQAAKALVAAKEQAESANRAKSEFLANMSHELRTPLNAIIGFSDILSGELLGPIGLRRYAEYAKDIQESAQHLLSLITDILDLSKIEAGQCKLSETAVDLSQIAATALRLIQDRASKSRVKLVNTLTRALPYVTADERSVKQMMVNLLNNGVKFTPEGGEVTLTAELRADGSLAFTVSDTGIGIAQNDIPRALAPFTQIDSALSRRFEGTGLGLPLVKSLIELHGGKLELTSTLGLGTQAAVIFPTTRVRA